MAERTVPTWLFVLLWTLLAAGVAATVFSFAQGARLAHISATLKEQAFVAEAGAAAEAQQRVRSSTLRTYAVILRAADSMDYTSALKPSLEDWASRQCPGQPAPVMQRVAYASPFCMVFERGPASIALVQAVRQGQLHALVLKGRAFKVRVATSAEITKLRAAQVKGLDRWLVLVAGDQQAVAGSPDCALPWAYAFQTPANAPANNNDNNDAFMASLATAEGSRGAHTRANVWAF